MRICSASCNRHRASPTRSSRSWSNRRKIVRFAVPVSLAAAASIAVLLMVTGGKTTQEPAMAAAAAGERVFLPAESAAVASGARTKGEQPTNTMVPQKRVMPWDAKVLGADAERGR